jgi:outer membrane beta-barrel protein
MIKTRIGLLVAAALCGLPAAALAQEEAAEEALADEAADAEEGAAAEMEAEEMEAEEEIADIEGEMSAPGGLKEICEIDPEACPNLDMKKEAARPLNPPLYAVQQIYALRRLRFELNPYWVVTLNDQFIDHTAPGMALNFYLTNVIAIGVNGAYHSPFNTDRDFNADVRRAARVGVPLNEYDWAAAFNITYVPAYGKFAGFQDFIFHYDAYLVAGGGAISTRPIPVFDPDYRNFEYEPKLAFNAGLGLRIFFNRWFAAMLEVRDYIYNERLESQAPLGTQQERLNKDTWFDDQKRLTNNVQAQLGVSIFIPFSFEYRLPK